MITPIDLAEAKYNARDALSMCRMFPHLVAEVERAGVTEVYNLDEQLADLALQMTRIGLPVNSERRAEIGQRLYALRDAAIETLRPFTEGDKRDSFLGWVANFFAARPRKGEPVEGGLRIGPTRAQAELDADRAALVEWKAYRKQLLAEGEGNPAEAVELLADADAQIASFEDKVRVGKLVLRASQYDDDAHDGLSHTAESAFEIRKAIRKADAELAISKKGVKWTAKIQQAAILRTAAVPITEVTEKSKLPKIDKEVLARFNRHEAARALLKFILVSSTINVYIEGEKRTGKMGARKAVMVTEDGYLHPEWICHKITGRWGSSPNVQNWSKRAGGGEENLRTMIEAPEGYVLVGFDFAQLEARLVGAMSQCKYLIDTFARGDDIHGAFAAIGFPNEWPQLAATFKMHKSALPKGQKCQCLTCAERDRVRDQTKRLEYGCTYGGQAPAIWSALVGEFPNLTQRQVQMFLDNFARQCPEVIIWRQNVLKEAIEQGEIRSPILGRREVFPLGRVDPTVAFNYKAQSGGADLWGLGAVAFMALWNQFNQIDVRIIHNGHDSALILTREDLAKQVEADARQCWERTWNGVQFLIDTKIAKQWSEA